jgi:hypothetical protein
MFVALTTDPIEVPTMLARLFDRLIAEAREDPRALTRAGDTRHLFPSSRRAHEPIHPTTLGRHLVRAGVHPQITRNYAMLALTNDMPAAVVAVQTGVTAQTASRWAPFSQRDRIEYLLARAEPAAADATPPSRLDLGGAI